MAANSGASVRRWFGGKCPGSVTFLRMTATVRAVSGLSNTAGPFARRQGQRHPGGGQSLGETVGPQPVHQRHRRDVQRQPQGIGRGYRAAIAPVEVVRDMVSEARERIEHPGVGMGQRPVEGRARKLLGSFPRVHPGLPMRTHGSRSSPWITEKGTGSAATPVSAPARRSYLKRTHSSVERGRS